MREINLYYCAGDGQDESSYMYQGCGAVKVINQKLQLGETFVVTRCEVCNTDLSHFRAVALDELGLPPLMRFATRE